MKIFSVYDDKADAFLPPFFFKTEAQALRAFAAAANEEGHDFQKHAADYTLFEIGDFSEQVGNIKGLDAIKNLGNALMMLKPEAKE